MGTLLQLVWTDKERFRPRHGSPPPGFPDVSRTPESIAWVGLTVPDLAHAERLFCGVLQGETDAAGNGWRLLTWGPQRRLLVRTRTATPGSGALWPDASGVAHLALGEPDLSPDDVRTAELDAVDPRVGLRVWRSPSERC